MEMMVSMRMDERKREEEREERRERERREEKAERLEREKRREEERLEREEQRKLELREQKKADLRREERLLTTLKEAQPAVPQQVNISHHKLPDMKDTDDIEMFVTMFESALLSNGIPEDQWKNKLHAHLTMKAKLKIYNVMSDHGTTYDEIKEALQGSAMSFSSAAEAFCIGEKGKLHKLELRQATEKMSRLSYKITQEAEDARQAADNMTVAMMRSWMVPELKTYVDMKQQFELQAFIRTAEEWEISQPEGTSWFKKTGLQGTPPYRQSQTGSQTLKKNVTCYHCGKVGHVSRECRTRIASDKLATHNPSQDATQTQATTSTRLERKPITCFNCHMLGHKSPQCPKKATTTVKQIQIPINHVKSLKDNELIGRVEDHTMPIMVDSGAEISVVPEECVGVDQFTGETCTANAFNSSEVTGKKCNVTVDVGGRVFNRTAMTLPGADISWTAILSFRITDDADREHLVNQLKRKDHQEEEEVLYMPPRMEHSTFHQAVLVSQGNVVEAEEDAPPVVTSEPEPQSEEVKVVVEHADVGDESREIEREESLGTERTTSSVDVEEAGDREGGSADSEMEVELSVESISYDEPRHKLTEATQADTTLATARALADKQQEEYYWADGLVFRTKLDRLGDNLEQLCLPARYRSKCLRMAHENFGHTGRNKMGEHIRRYFYSPSITTDSIKHVKSCLVCLKKDKSNPRPMPMQAREIVTIPSERVAIDIVGPFSVSRGVFRFLLTYLDMATRWPEAILLRKTTTKIITEQLTLVFSRCGFPTTLISDNGPQFVAKSFKKWLRDKGISHVRASPYHPQGNGVVERMHRTLSNVIARCTESKGNWAQIVPMAMYFLRCMPSRATGLSPFRAKHGWEPTTPLQILYKGWVQQDLGPVDLEEWTTVNAERVQHAREVVVVNLQNSSDERKKQWNKRAQTRQFEQGDQVFLRKSGLNTKLADSWEGPYLVMKRNTPLSYKINTGDRILPSVHIQLLEAYTPRQEDPKVQRVTSVLEPDTLTDQMDEQYAEAKVTGSVVTEDRQKDIRCWEKDYSDILTREPGLTKLKQFRIDTGDHAPI